MNNPKKKDQARVVSIQGAHKQDIISQEELRQAADLQAAEWLTAQSVQKSILRLLDRIENNAALIEDGSLEFDRELRMVRSKKEKAG
jgi:hypothetical protein